MKRPRQRENKKNRILELREKQRTYTTVRAG